MDEEMVQLLSLADLALGRLDGASTMLPNPDLFVYGYVRREAVLSSQIEGTQTSLADLLEFEPDPQPRSRVADTPEVVNYVHAMNYGLERLKDGERVSNGLIRDIHRILLKGARGQDRNPGEWRKHQNWIGSPACTINQAVFVPPPPDEMGRAMDDLDRYIRFADPTTPTLVKCGLVKGQFETIHPFGDGNGRLGRLLITFMLCEEQVLSRPLLYLSDYFNRHKGEYYARLQDVRDSGNWEDWLKFFLRGVAEVSQEGFHTALEILKLREEHRSLVVAKIPDNQRTLELLEHLYLNPYIWVDKAAELLTISYHTAQTQMENLVKIGLLVEVGTRGGNPLYRYDAYVYILGRGTEVPELL